MAADNAKGMAMWFETVAEAERMAAEERAHQFQPAGSSSATVSSPDHKVRPPRPVLIAPAAPSHLDALRSLIAKRHELVNKSLFTDIKRLAAGAKLTKKQLRSLTDWFGNYSQMRCFVPTSRKDPNLNELIVILEDALRHRKDFVEGRILVVPCLVYAGKLDNARTHLEEASKFLDQKGLNYTPFRLDCCWSWLSLQEPTAVERFVDAFKNPRVVPEKQLTATQSMIVSVHSYQMFRFHAAKDYLEKALRKADAMERPAESLTEGMLADAAFFYLVAGNPKVRDANRGEMLLDKIPAGSNSWVVRRARAALKASKAMAAQGEAAEALWDAAVDDLKACRQESLPTLDTEIDEQLERYRRREPWFHERPKQAASTADDAAYRPPVNEVVAGALR